MKDVVRITVMVPPPPYEGEEAPPAAPMTPPAPPKPSSLRIRDKDEDE